MTVLYLEALIGIALSLSILMALAWVVQQRTGNSGWVDTIWTFAVGLVGAASALLPVAGAALDARQWLVAALVTIWSLRLGVHIAIRTTGISDDPRYAAFAAEWGADSPRRMFVFLQNQALGSIPLVFAIFVAAHVPVALSTDDEGVSRIELTHEYTRAALDYHLTYQDMKQLARTGMEHNFLSGTSLWAKPDKFVEANAACKDQELGGSSPSDGCKRFLAGSEKASAQWEHERRFREFESRF